MQNLLTKYIVALILLLLVTRLCNAQYLHIKATVADSTTQESIGFVTIKLKKQGTAVMSNAGGQFELPVNGTAMLNDTLIFSCVGYLDVRMRVSALKNNAIVYMARFNAALNAVTVTGTKKVKDSVVLRQLFKKDYTFKKYKVIDAIRPLSINVDILYASLSRESKQRKKLQRILVTDEKANYVNSRFSKKLVTQVTGLEGEAMQIFMEKYRPTYEALLKLTDYELIVYIKNSLNLAKPNN